jgi:hypothetical protein
MATKSVNLKGAKEVQMKKLRIVSDGTAQGTKVYCGEHEIQGITRLEILPIEVGGVVTAKLTFSAVELDMEAESDGA